MDRTAAPEMASGSMPQVQRNGKNGLHTDLLLNNIIESCLLFFFFLRVSQVFLWFQKYSIVQFSLCSVSFNAFHPQECC